MTDAADTTFDLTSWLVERDYEDHRGSAEIFFVCATFGARCFVHFKAHEAWEKGTAERLLTRVRETAPDAEHILASPCWRPHPYADGTLAQRLAVEAEVEAHERATHGTARCDPDHARAAATDEFIG